MTSIVAKRELDSDLSDAARRRILSVRGEPLFYADWLRALFIHYEVDAETLQRATPYELDLRDGRAYVSLVAFTMRGMRPRFGGKLGALLFRPIATHEFLNVRTYVKHRGETGIFFLAEWLANPLSVKLGPITFGLPYRLGRFNYEHQMEQGALRGWVSDANGAGRLEYGGEINNVRGWGERTREPTPHGFIRDWLASTLAPPSGQSASRYILFQPCTRNTQDEFLMERYTAFTGAKSRGKFFRIWHPPWPQAAVDIHVINQSLLTNVWPWFADAQMIGANYSPGVERVWMGRPHNINRLIPPEARKRDSSRKISYFKRS